MELHTLNAKLRQPNGKGPARRIRRAGDVPVVLYGGDKEAVALVLNRKEFEKVLHGKGGEHAVVQLTVQDDGIGFDPQKIKPDHFGLGIMRERALQAGAQFSINSQPGMGTTLTLSWQAKKPLDTGEEKK